MGEDTQEALAAFGRRSGRSLLPARRDPPGLSRQGESPRRPRSSFTCGEQAKPRNLAHHGCSPPANNPCHDQFSLIETEPVFAATTTKMSPEALTTWMRASVGGSRRPKASNFTAP